MKAEHRKELNTNLLADRMGRLVQGVKAGSAPKSAIVWVIGGLALATVVGWYWARWTGSSSAAWIAFNNYETRQDPVAALRDIATNYPGTVPARTARCQRARMLLNAGLSSIYNTAHALPAVDAHERARDDSVRGLEEARRLFQGLIPECSENAILEQEMLMGAAKAEEALAGVPNPDDTDLGLGSLDEALKIYKRLADTYPESDLGIQAAARCDELENQRTKIDEFYAEFRAAGQRRSPLGSPFPFDPFAPRSP